jgi:hypothetical protein
VCVEPLPTSISVDPTKDLSIPVVGLLVIPHLFLFPDLIVSSWLTSSFLPVLSQVGLVPTSPL